MAGSGYVWADPPALPAYENVWSGADQPPSYEEALMWPETPHFQAPVLSGPMFPSLPDYQAPGAQMSTLTRSQAPGAQMSTLTRSQAPGAQMSSLTRSQGPGAQMSTLTRSQAPGAQMSSLTRSQGPGAQMSSLTRSQGPGAQMNSLTRSHEPGAPGTLTRSQSRDSDGVQRVMSNEELMTWWRTVKPWEKMSHFPDTEPRVLAKKVHRVQRALTLYGLLMRTHGEDLQSHIAELQRTSDNIGKAYNTLKAARVTSGVTSGASGAVGGAAAVTGIVLAPFTMGVSLVITALGVGVVAAGGIKKASVKNKMGINQDRKALESILQDYRKKLEDIEACLQFIYTGMDHIGRNNLSILKGADMDAGRVARMLEMSGEVAQGLGATSRSSDLLREFAGGIGTFYSQKDYRLLKRGKEKKFAHTLSKAASRLQSTQDDLTRVAALLGRF
ncbi:uncharacterized protein LOC116219864 isoform X2 [Clupea harengus]|uniref:Uncharacterized protein LOC116219864 isoform X2 n=1 Tax=Clupea harengus TaxID=7950 RepID=A0A6P8EU53_CLUHA|nr:uncharacterized protein LOC116219864 isoform X2 [Clupea harengus]